MTSHRSLPRKKSRRHHARSISRSVSVSAKHGKRVRAEPIAMLEEQGRLHSVGVGMDGLETQMATADLDGDDDDDRIDAMVHAFTELMLGGASNSDPLKALAALAG